eukprot:TRINITY_DN32786_c0_g1_i1.p1 TRINITY_DN32786_c0_g1~~TRINITY_DN32786_c0_g1_i1.p1  ORF type:complete len:212 (+),score=17.28 TRINITY_DN32786_c0_g1_i1:51-686(+)
MHSHSEGTTNGDARTSRTCVPWASTGQDHGRVAIWLCVLLELLHWTNAAQVRKYPEALTFSVIDMCFHTAHQLNIAYCYRRFSVRQAILFAIARAIAELALPVPVGLPASFKKGRDISHEWGVLTLALHDALYCGLAGVVLQVLLCGCRMQRALAAQSLAILITFGTLDFTYLYSGSSVCFHLGHFANLFVLNAPLFQYLLPEQKSCQHHK